ncbi:MAG: M1 family metallopeptidase [Saprospiraceae bacterium]|nr:M1 family metallopeptidase [Saprospiraceae bacterium]
MFKQYFSLLLLVGCSFSIFSQSYWQQEANYFMDVNLDSGRHHLKGKQTIDYSNNSPDTLTKLFYHLYFNAFQPNSEMDLRSRNLPDPDRRVGDRISKLSNEEIGYQRIKSLTMNGKRLAYQEEGTILEVFLKHPILPGQKVKLEMEFESQIPVQIRRSGRNNKEGIDYSMAQWYPKLCEYDEMGWHPNPYVAREFYGVWGNFDVKLTMDSKYIVAATGVLQNAAEIGYGYSEVEVSSRPKKHTWHFKAEKVHDFMWAADPDYKHTQIKANDGTVLHFFYQENEKTKDAWERLPKIADEALKWMNERYGKYPYPVYSFVQGGDGGMEYPMATLVTGERSLMSLVGVCIHEWMHSWYQMVLATNEALYPWMDEGFTSFGASETMDHLIAMGLLKGKHDENPLDETITGYSNFALSGSAEALSTHADHYMTNTAYSVGSYTKGQLCLVQLEYIMGKEKFGKALKKYYETWKFKHPDASDFFRLMEKESGLVLDWFAQYWVNTTHVTDYAIDTVYEDQLFIRRVGEMPMPLDIVVTLNNGKKELYYIPLVLMREEKEPEVTYTDYTKLADWPWAQTVYKVQLNQPLSKIARIEIDPSNRMIDVMPDNNVWPRITKEEIDKK